MIEFTSDGPFAEKADPLFPDRVRIVGLGQTGVAVCDQLILHGRPGQDLWVFDSDQQTIEASIVANRHLIGHDLVRGLGCNGDLELAREIVALEEDRLAHVARGCDFLILVLGLASSTGMAMAEHLIERSRETGAKVIVVGAQPFACEGRIRREKSLKAITNLRSEADSVLVLSHDLLSDHPTTLKNIRHGFHLMHQIMAQATQALTQVVCKRGLIQLSFADVRSLYARYTGTEVLENCWVGHVEGDVHDCTEDLIEKLLESPLLSDESIWKQADHAIVAVSGACDLALSDVQEMVGALKDRLPITIPIATSASLDDETHEKVRMTVLLATTAPVPVIPAEIPGAKKLSTKSKAKPGVETTPLPKPTVQARLEPPITQPLPQPEKTKPTRPQAPPQKDKPAPVPAEQSALVAEERLASAEIETGPLASVASPSSRRFLAKQEEMQFEAPTRGRFEKTHETMYRGENLDQPTFRRRGIAIKLDTAASR